MVAPRVKPYQTTMFVQLDTDVALDDRVVFLHDVRWGDCLQELAKAPWIVLDTEFHGPSGPFPSRRDIDYWRSTVRLIQAGLPSGRVMVFDLGGMHDRRDEVIARHAESLSVLRQVIENPRVPKAGMALLTEYLLLRIHFGWKMRCMRDIMLLSQVVWAGVASKKARWTEKGLVAQRPLQHNMAAICARLGISVDKSEQKSDWAGKLANRQYNYAARDVIHPRQAWVELTRMAKRDGLMNTFEAETGAQPGFCECEYNGLPIDMEVARADITTWERVRDQFLQPFIDLFPGVNPLAPLQAAEALERAMDVYACGCGATYDPLLQQPKGQPLFAQPATWRCECGAERDKLQPTRQRLFTIEKPDRGKLRKFPTTADDVLAPYIDIWYVNALLEGRSTSTCLSWLKGAVENAFVGPDGGGTRIRADFKQIAGGYSEHGAESGEAGAGMGRSSASRPINTQNPSNLQPAHAKAGAPSVRRCIRPAKGRAFVVADLSQAHWRIAAQVSQDPIMLRDCRAGRDAHLAMTHRVMVSTGHNITLEEAERIKGDPKHPLNKEFLSRRQGTKSSNYACINMTGAKTLKKQMETMPVPVYMELEQVAELIRIWRHEVYTGLHQFQKAHVKKVNSYRHRFDQWGVDGEYGEARTLTNRRLYLVKEWQPPRQWSDGTWSQGRWSVKGTDAVSFIWMGTEADLIKHAMGCLVPIFDAHPEWDVRWANMAHDELDLDCDESYALDVATVTMQAMDDAMQWAGVVDLPVNEPGADPKKLIKADWSAK